MSQPYQVIIVGAGILGWSTAIHLQRLGIQRIAVIDRV